MIGLLQYVSAFVSCECGNANANALDVIINRIETLPTTTPTIKNTLTVIKKKENYFVDFRFMFTFAPCIPPPNSTLSPMEMNYIKLCNAKHIIKRS